MEKDFKKLVKSGAQNIELTLNDIKLNMRKPKVRDLYNISGDISDYQAVVIIIANLTDVPKEYIMDLDLSDFEIAREALEAFL